VTPRLAVILAAGRGIRLGARGRQTPKGFIHTPAGTLIERSIEVLREAGIERVVIVTGHLSGHYSDLAGRLGDWVTLVHNPAYARSGSLVSLISVGPLDEPYLLVESDLLYERRAPRLLIESTRPDVLLASGATGSGDEVYVGIDAGHLVDLTKQRSRLLGTYAGELVGLTRVSPALHARILAEAVHLMARTRHVEYEEALVAVARHHPLAVHVVDDLVWAEIDDANHLTRALATVVPRLD
jgi:choline kinase